MIKPSWRRHHKADDEVVIDLDPGMAFGTGLHPTTRLCLEALEARADRGPLGRALDVGCGSGILSIAAVKLGATRAVGVDIDPIAIEATVANARHNRVGKRVRAREGTIPSGEGPFDLVLANLIAGLLVELAANLAAELVPGGTLIASGIFIDREPEVRRALRGRRARDHRAPRTRRTGSRSRRSARPEYNPAAMPQSPCSPCFWSRTSRSRLRCSCRRCCCRSRSDRGAARSRRRTSGRFVRFLLALQARGTVWIGAGLAISGLALVSTLGAGRAPAAVAARRAGIYAFNLGARVLHPGAAAAQPHRAPIRQRLALAGPRATAALHLVCHGRPRGYHRLPDEHEAGPLVSARERRGDATARPGLPVLPDRRGRDPVDAASPRTSWRSRSATSRRGRPRTSSCSPATTSPPPPT